MAVHGATKIATPARLRAGPGVWLYEPEPATRNHEVWTYVRMSRETGGWTYLIP